MGPLGNGGEAVIDRWMRTGLVMEEEQIWAAKVKLAGKVMYLMRNAEDLE